MARRKKQSIPSFVAGTTLVGAVYGYLRAPSKEMRAVNAAKGGAIFGAIGLAIRTLGR
jgi:hypothetical protein